MAMSLIILFDVPIPSIPKWMKFPMTMYFMFLLKVTNRKNTWELINVNIMNSTLRGSC